jgi:hypothetical protein
LQERRDLVERRFAQPVLIAVIQPDRLAEDDDKRGERESAIHRSRVSVPGTR